MSTEKPWSWLCVGKEHKVEWVGSLGEVLEGLGGECLSFLLL